MSKPSDSKNKPISPWLEFIKTSSIFLSSVVIAFASIIVTMNYNSKQLKIATNKDLSLLIPKLGSNQENEQKFSAVVLGLYGKEAIPALIAILDDGREDVGYAAVKSLTIIGKDAIPDLLKAYKTRGSSPSLKGWCLYALGELGAKEVYALAVEVLQNMPEDTYLIQNLNQNAATALGLLEDKKALPDLLTALAKCKNSDSVFSKTIFWALENIWASSKIGSDEIIKTLTKMEASDSIPFVRYTAHNKIEWYKKPH
jgi:hypothetical protein